MTEAQLEALLQRLKEGKHAGVARNLDILHQVCLDERKKKGTANLSVRNIGAESSARNGVSASHIYGKPGRLYRDLLDAHVTAHNRSQPRDVNDLPSPKDREDYWISRIDMHEVKFAVKQIRAERDRLARENANLREWIEHDKASSVRELPLSDDGDLKPAPALAATLTPDEIAELRRACDPETYREGEWSVRADGSVIAGARGVIFEPAFLTALRRIVAAHDG